MVANAVFTTPLAARVLNVSAASEDRLWRILHGFHNRCFSQQLLRCSTVVHTEVGARSDEEMCTHSIRNSTEASQGLSISHNEIAVPRLHPCSAPGQQQSSACSGKTARQYTVFVQIKNRCKPARPNVHSSLESMPPILGCNHSPSIPFPVLASKHTALSLRLGRFFRDAYLSHS